LPADIPNALGDSPETLLMRGGSCIVDPLGKVLAGPVFDEETILFAELDLDEIARGQDHFDVSGQYARADVFQLYENARPANPGAALVRGRHGELRRAGAVARVEAGLGGEAGARLRVRGAAPGRADLGRARSAGLRAGEKAHPAGRPPRRPRRRIPAQRAGVG